MRKYCCLALLLCLLLCACSANGGLTALPRTEEELPLVARHILPQLTGTAEYIIPASGDVDRPAMEIDLNGDGEYEILACLMKRVHGVRRPCVEIYTYREDRLTKAGELIGEGDHIRDLRLPLWKEDGSAAVAVVWGLADTALGGMTVCLLTEDGVGTLYSGPCLALDAADMDRDGLDELVLLERTDEGLLEARMLDGRDDSVAVSDPVPLSAGTELLSARTANIGFDRTALLCEGYIENLGYLTDVILCGADGVLRSVFCGEAGGVSGDTLRDLPIPCADVNGDGTVELPRIRDTAERVDAPSEGLYIVDWYRCDSGSDAEPLCASCYHGTYGWNVRLPDVGEQWIRPVRSAVTDTVDVVLFYLISGEEERGTPLWGLYTLSGEDAEETADLIGLRRIAAEDGTVYAYQIYQTSYGSPFTDSTIPGLFSLPG